MRAHRSFALPITHSKLGVQNSSRLDSMSTSHAIGFIGAGKMATALAIGFPKSGLTESGKLIASDVHEGPGRL